MKYKTDDLIIRRLGVDEPIPYALLLLADETVNAINKYIFEAEILVADQKGDIVGVCVLKAMDHQTMEIKNIAVHQEVQGKSIGTRLINFVSQLSAGRGFTDLIVGTCDQCLKEIVFYKKAGFDDFKIIRNYFPDNYDQPIYENGNKILDLVVLKKSLTE